MAGFTIGIMSLKTPTIEYFILKDEITFTSKGTFIEKQLKETVVAIFLCDERVWNLVDSRSFASRGSFPHRFSTESFPSKIFCSTRFDLRNFRERSLAGSKSHLAADSATKSLLSRVPSCFKSICQLQRNAVSRFF